MEESEAPAATDAVFEAPHPISRSFPLLPGVTVICQTNKGRMSLPKASPLRALSPC